MATTTSDSNVQKLYIAYFGRAADPTGLAFYSDALANGTTTIEAIASSFATSSEAQPIIALSTGAFLTAMYQQAFARAYDPSPAVDGTFWADAIDSGATTQSLAMVQILQGAEAGGQDASAVANKVTVATAFTAALGTQGSAYAGAEAVAAAKAVLTPVTFDAATVATGNTAAESVVAGFFIIPEPEPEPNLLLGTFVAELSAEKTATLTFLSDGTYVQIQNDVDPVFDGYEVGTWSFDESNGSLTVAVAYDTNSDAGLLDGPGSASFSASVDSKAFTITVEDEGTFVLSRLESDENKPEVGSWLIRPGVSNDTEQPYLINMFAEGLITAMTINVNDPEESGVFASSYTLDGDSLLLRDVTAGDIFFADGATQLSSNADGTLTLSGIDSDGPWLDILIGI
ncbi:hypothetical protein A9Q89_09055 [Gammaproteobacteria bacterium 53_120_T64]|nr:hypothetical protein A9Q89_09055 [Gammaproteobacteria bacterium 53_120_T64]